VVGYFVVVVGSEKLGLVLGLVLGLAVVELELGRLAGLPVVRRRSGGGGGEQLGHHLLCRLFGVDWTFF